MIVSLLNSIRYSLRALRQNPRFSVAALIVMTLGLGAATAMFTVVNAVLLSPLPYPEPSRLIFLSEVNRGGDAIRVSSLDFRDWQSQNRSFEAMSCFGSEEVHVVAGGEAELVYATGATAGFFSIFRVKPTAGRLFSQDDERLNAPPAVLLSHEFWVQRYGADQSAIGSTLRFMGIPFTIIGVLPPDFRYPARTDLWVSRDIFPDTSARSAHNCQVVGRLKPDVSLTQARKDLETIAARLQQQYPETNDGIGLRLTPLQQYLTGDRREILILLFAAVVLLLLIACVNVANLQLVRVIGLQRTNAIKLALGGRQSHLIQQSLIESVILSLLGGAAGMTLAGALLKLLLPLTLFHSLIKQDLIFDMRSWGFALGLSVFAGLLFGLPAALQAPPETALLGSLHQASWQSPGSGKQRSLLKGLVAVEVAISIVLLAGAGLLASSFLHLLRVNLGFQPSNVLIAEMSLPTFNSAWGDPARVSRFYQELVARAQTISGISGVALTSDLPLSGLYRTGNYTTEQDLTTPDSQKPVAVFGIISSNYFNVMQIPMLEGRAFDEQDRAGVPGVAIINSALARRQWRNQSPIGQRIRLDGMEKDADWLTIVGVCGDVRHQSIDIEPEPEVYAPFVQHEKSLPALQMVARTVKDPTTFAPAMRGVIRNLDREIPIRIQTMEQLQSASLIESKFRTILVSLFALAALILTSVGIYAVSANAVHHRTREIGIRMALGAQTREISWLILWQGMLPVLTGSIIGLLAALALSRLIQSLLFGISSFDFKTYAATLLSQLIVSLMAIYLPARRASRLHPLMVLRNE